MFLMNLVLDIIKSLIATAIGGIIIYAYRNRIWDWIITYVYPPSVIKKSSTQINPRKVRTALLRRLRRDQSRIGQHYGQFGRETSMGEVKKYQTGKENISTKPRMYLTVWPCITLEKHHLEPRMLALAAKGTQKIFLNDRIRVYPPATRETLPNRQPHMISYRHTICGALLLFHLRGWSPTVRNVVDAMIDKQNGWQNPDGGWAQCDREYTNSDLWGSAYAIRLLAQVIADQSAFSEQERNIASEALSQTIRYFMSRWEENKWSYGGSSSPENAPLLLIEIAPIFAESTPEFLKSVIAHFRQWLAPSGNLSKTYIASCGELSDAALMHV